MMRLWQRISLIAVLIIGVLLTPGMTRYGATSMESPPWETKKIASPKLHGSLIAMSDTAEAQAAFVITGVCQGQSFVLGPLITFLLDPFHEFVTAELLKGSFIDTFLYADIIHLPASCFAGERANGSFIGFVVDSVERYRLISPEPPGTATLVIARIVLSGVYLPYF